MKTLIALALTALFLAGCSSEPSTGEVYEKDITMKDGRTVTCLIFDSYQEAGMDCDWEDAK